MTNKRQILSFRPHRLYKCQLTQGWRGHIVNASKICLKLEIKKQPFKSLSNAFDPEIGSPVGI